MSMALIALVFMIVGAVFGVVNNETRTSTFWFWLALLTAVLLSPFKF